MEYWLLHSMDQTLFVSNKHITSRIMHFLCNNFFLVCNIIMWEENFNILWLCFPRNLSSGKTQLQFPLYPWHWGLGLCFYPLKDMRFQQLTPSYDYYPKYTLCCNTLVLLILHRLISLRGCFPSPPDPFLPSELLL